jgi:hypothetical protein
MKLAAARTSLLLFKFLAFHAPIVSTVYLLCACMCVLAAHTTHTRVDVMELLPPSSECVRRLCRIASAALALVSHTIAQPYCVLCTCHSKFNHADWLRVLCFPARAPSSASNDAAAASANDPGQIPGRFAPDAPPTPPFSQVSWGVAGPKLHKI